MSPIIIRTGLHIDIAHPGLTRLFGGDYRIHAGEHVDRMSGDLVDGPLAEPFPRRAYQALLARRGPALALLQIVGRTSRSTFIPDQVDFMHFVPVGPTETLIRENQLRAGPTRGAR